MLLLSVHGLAVLAKATASGTVYRAAVAATGALAVGAFILSFVALCDLAVIAGIRPGLASVLPLVIDLRSASPRSRSSQSGINLHVALVARE